MEPTKIAYLAGLVDGEGCISIVRQNRVDNLCNMLVVGMSDKEGPEMFKEVFGGSVLSRRRRHNYKVMYTWRVYSRQAARALEILYPYLVIKKKQADICLELAKSIKDGNVLSRGPWRKKVSPDRDIAIKAFRNDLCNKLKEIHKSG